MYMINVNNKKAIQSGLWSMGIVLCGAFSIESYVEDSIRYVTEAMLYETSLVSIPADPTSRFRNSDKKLNNF